MSRLREKQAPVIKRLTFSDSELDQVLKEAGGLTNEARLSWLESKGAIRIRNPKNSFGDTFQDIAIVQLTDGSYPFSLLDDKWSALRAREDKKNKFDPWVNQSFDSIRAQVSVLLNRKVI